MKKSILVIIVSAFILYAMAMSTFLNAHFSFLSFMRTWAVNDNFQNDYIIAVEALDEFSEDGDYQKWLVTSGSTVTGKVVRLAVMFLELVVAFFALIIMANNFIYLKRRIKKAIKRKRKKD